MVLSPEQQDLFNQRREKVAALRQGGVDPYPSAFERTTTSTALAATYASLSQGESTQDAVKVAGRLMAMRNSGLFLDVHDDGGKIQVFCKPPTLCSASQSLLELLDLGDFVGVEGTVRRTPRGELTVDARELSLLSKAYLPLPDKYHGLQDTELRYRRRYLDLLANPSSREVLRKRSAIVGSFRRFLEGRGFLEVETPMLHPIAGGALARPFATHHNAFDSTFYLRIAPELYLKRLIVGGLSEKVFEINRCFRNEGVSTRHNPEFTSLELYEAYTDFQAMIRLTEELVGNAALEVWGDTRGVYGDHALDLTPPWPRKTMAQLVFEATGVDFLTLDSDLQAHQVAHELGVALPRQAGWGKVLETIFSEKVEKTLIQPTHVTHFPREISPLAKACPQDLRLTERFETYINGWEIANGFSELNDPVDQRDRFLEQEKAKEGGAEEVHGMDEDFVLALSYGLPPTGGLGIGMDRLVMILTQSTSIREVIPFPTLKPKET